MNILTEIPLEKKNENDPPTKSVAESSIIKINTKV
jgi:hypothetical protein